jgi:hypothetical protein
MFEVMRLHDEEKLRQAQLRFTRSLQSLEIRRDQALLASGGFGMQRFFARVCSC